MNNGFNLNVTNVFERNIDAITQGKRRALNEGGTSSSKTYSIMQLLCLIAQHTSISEPLLISIVSETLPHLKRGCIRDFVNIMGDLFDSNSWNKTDNIYTFPNARIEFFSADNPSKLRGARRDILYINECNNIPLESFRELDIRTNKFTFLDWNPVSEFWAHTELMGKPENAYIHSTYLDAKEFLPEEVVRNIESMKDDKNWWNVYGLGLVGKVEGLVYPEFNMIDEMPDGKKFYGLDWGYTDPTAVCECIVSDDALYSKQVIYQSNLTISELRNLLSKYGIIHETIWCDNASPMLIEELKSYGFDARPCPKGAGSVEFGHQKVRQYKQFWTKDSLDAISEQRNFRYIKDGDGNLTDKTDHHFSHMMDARRYAIVGETECSSFSYTRCYKIINDYWKK